MSPRISADRVRTLLSVVGEVRESLRAGEDVFSQFGESFSRLLGADVVAVVLGVQDARARINLLELKTFGLSQSESAQARRAYLVDLGEMANVAAAKALALSKERGAFAVKLRRELVCDDVWYRSDFIGTYRRAWGLDDAIYGSHVMADGRLVGFGSCRAWGARPFDEEDCALAGLFWERCAAELTPPESRLSPRQRETLLLLLEGHSAKGIAARLGLSVNTVKEYVRAVYRAKKVRSRGELMALAIRGTRDHGIRVCGGSGSRSQ